MLPVCLVLISTVCAIVAFELRLLSTFLRSLFWINRTIDELTWKRDTMFTHSRFLNKMHVHSWNKWFSLNTICINSSRRHKCPFNCEQNKINNHLFVFKFKLYNVEITLNSLIRTDCYILLTFQVSYVFIAKISCCKKIVYLYNIK